MFHVRCLYVYLVIFCNGNFYPSQSLCGWIATSAPCPPLIELTSILGLILFILYPFSNRSLLREGMPPIAFICLDASKQKQVHQGPTCQLLILLPTYLPMINYHVSPFLTSYTSIFLFVAMSPFFNHLQVGLPKIKMVILTAPPYLQNVVHSEL